MSKLFKNFTINTLLLVAAENCQSPSTGPKINKNQNISKCFLRLKTEAKC